MASESLIEIIWHFAGHFRIFNDVARDRIDYDRTSPSGPPADFVSAKPNYDPRIVPDDLETEGFPPPTIVGDELANAARVAVKPAKSLGDPIPDDLAPEPQPPALPLAPRAGGGGGGGGGQQDIIVTYQSGGEQSQIEIRQTNILNDNDILLHHDVALPPALITQMSHDVVAAVSSMIEETANEVPAELRVAQSGAGAVELVTALDAAAVTGSSHPLPTVAPGLYINGVQQEVAPSLADREPIASPDPLPDTGHGTGQWAVLGSNHSLNVALIVDVSASARTMVVNGDYFHNNIIVQTNASVDEDVITSSGGAGTSATTGGTTLTNSAEFIANPGIYSSAPDVPTGPVWRVDIVYGDYFDVHALVQRNYLSDNDIVQQVSSDTHYVVTAGFNQLSNVAQLFAGSIHYDLIVVEGSYHGLNIIFQHNILLNNDRIDMSASGSDPDQSASSGGNTLSNTAAIEVYGGDTFQSLTPAVDSIFGALSNGVTSLDPDFALILPGTGGIFEILYIRGDYYDVNAIWQTNITTDVNIALQLQNQPAGELPLIGDTGGATTQSVTTGGNSLVNDATIVDVKPTDIFLVGQAYGDAILIQANLLPDDDLGRAVNADAQQLVSELVAFVTDVPDDLQPESLPMTVACAVQTDPIASVLH